MEKNIIKTQNNILTDSGYKKIYSETSSDLVMREEENKTVESTILDIESDIVDLFNNKAPIIHNHTTSDISDFPSSLPASDVYDWAKTETKPIYTASEVGALPSDTIIPTKTSELTNDSGFLTSIPEEYITETKLNEKDYLTEHQDISGLASKDDLHIHENKSVLDTITNKKISEWNNKSDFSGNYSDLIGTPIIPTVTNDLTDELKAKYDKAEENVQPDWNEVDDTSDAFIKNKPSVYTKNEVDNRFSALENNYEDANSKKHNHDNKSILDKITQSFLDNWNTAYTHADSAHAPSNAEKNTILTIKKNGTALTPDDSRAVNIEIPTDYIVYGSQTETSTSDGGSNVYTFTNNNGFTSTFTVKNGSKGSPGSNGTNGKDGTSVSISSTSVTYQVSSSGTVIPTGTWSTSVPNTSAGQYLWTKTAVTYSDGKSTTAYSISRNGTDGTNATTTAVATQTANGLMSSSDKKRLDSIADGANNYVHPTTSGNKHIPSGGTSGQILKWSSDGTASWGYISDESLAVTGIKGNSETTYRTGNVNLTPSNIGAVNKNGDTISGDISVTGAVYASNWLRTYGATGWYNQTYGGGWYMTDSTYIRNYNSKHLLLSGNCYFGNTSYYINSSGGARLQLVRLGNTNYGLNSDGSANLGGLTLINNYLKNSSGDMGLANDTVKIGLWSSAFRPHGDYAGSVTLGTSSVRWGQIYTTKAVSVSSDRKIKNNIEYLASNQKYERFFTGLKPSRYRLNDETDGRYHIGFIAQDVEEELLKAGLTKADFAGLSIEEDFYSLCYEEFIPLITAMQQSTISRVDTQEEKIRNLQNQLNNLQFELEQAKLRIKQLE